MTVLYHKRPTEELAHLAWCILVAVRLAQRENKAAPGLQLHIFLMQWLKNAQKRKLFPKTVAPDILWLLNQGEKYGHRVNLLTKVEYIWRSSSGELAGQSDLFRFTWLIETLKTMNWRDYLLSASEWSEGTLYSDTVQAVYTPKAALHPSFSDSGALLQPLPLRFTGDVSGLSALFSDCCLRAERQPDEAGFAVFMLMPEAI